MIMFKIWDYTKCKIVIERVGFEPQVPWTNQINLKTSTTELFGYPLKLSIFKELDQSSEAKLTPASLVEGLNSLS